MHTSDEMVAGYGRLPNLIAYFSICMVAAAWGAMVRPEWCAPWSIFGAIGIISAVGLDVRDRSRFTALLRRRQQEAAQQLEQKLDDVVRGIQSVDAIRHAVRQIVPDIDEVRACSAGRRQEVRLPMEMPVTLIPVRTTRDSDAGSLTDLVTGGDEAGEAPGPIPDADPGETFTATLRDISLRAFGLSHDRPIPRGSWVLIVEFVGGQRVRLLGDLLWCERQDDGSYFSGGKFQRVAGCAEPAALGSEPAVALPATQ